MILLFDIMIQINGRIRIIHILISWWSKIYHLTVGGPKVKLYNSFRIAAMHIVLFLLKIMTQIDRKA